MLKIITATLLALILGGCMVGPDYRRPAVDTPQSWRFEEKETQDLVNTAWWEQFNDPVLNGLIGIAIRENKDVKIAAARVEEFRGRYTVARAPLFPQIGAGASAGGSRQSALQAAPLIDTQNPADLFQPAFSASWEIDLWGKLRRGTEAAHANLLSSEEGRRSVILSLVSSVAAAYVSLRDLDRQLEIARNTTKSREDSYKIFAIRFQGGLISDLELYQVKSLYEQALATIPVIEKAIVQQEDALNVLLGRNPGTVKRGKSIEQLELPAVPEGLPSALLERRPDIRRAEQDLVSANARIGVARAMYFPDISLTGMFGWESTKLSNLFTGPASMWSLAVPVTQPIFTAGAIAGQVKMAEAVREQALLQYRQVIQNAFRDMEDALADQRHTREQFEAQARQVETLRHYVKVARLRYDNGYTSYIEVLDAERSLFDAELSYTQTQGGLRQALINIYKAMGGGWVVTAEKVSMNPG
jgi:multidrug efflux system outer membrane protein